MAPYNPYFYPQQQSQNQQQQINNTGLIPVPSEQVARNYPVAYGQSVSFRDENAPYLYTKTMGFSQLDTPKFEKYKLIKEETHIETPDSCQNDSEKQEVINNTINKLKSEIDMLWNEIDILKKKSNANNKKKNSDGED